MLSVLVVRPSPFLASLLMTCACGTKAGDTQMSAYPTLSSLSNDPAKRADQLDSSNQRPDAEQNASKTEKQIEVETVAATAAAIIGSFFSTGSNVIIGTRTRFEENRLFEKPIYLKDDNETKKASSVKDQQEVLPGACLLLLVTRPKSCDKPPDAE